MEKGLDQDLQTYGSVGLTEFILNSCSNLATFYQETDNRKTLLIVALNLQRQKMKYLVCYAYLARSVHLEKKNIDFFYAIYRKYASMSSDVSVRNTRVIFENRVLFLTLHHKAYNLI